MQFMISANYFSTKMSVCSQHQVFPAYFNHLCSFTIPGCDCWFCSTLISGEHGHLGWPTLLRGAVELGRFLSRKPPPSPPLPQLLLASCWKAFFSLLSSASHSSPCQHLEHRCSALRLPPGTSHRGSRRGNNKLLLQRTFLSNTIIVYSKKKHHLCSAESRCCCKISCRCYSCICMDRPRPRHGRWEKQWCDKVASAGSPSGQISCCE